MWKTHFLVCMWATGLLCGLAANLPLEKRFLENADTPVPHVCVMNVYLSSALRVYECVGHPQ